MFNCHNRKIRRVAKWAFIGGNVPKSVPTSNQTALRFFPFMGTDLPYAHAK